MIIRIKHYLITAVAVFLMCGRLYAGGHQKHVLYISSYNPSFPTFFQQVDGINSVFNDKGILLDIEFMDTKRFPDAGAVELFHGMLKSKMKRLAAYDAVIVADDAALRYADKQRNNLFRNIPVFFCGINDLDYARSLESRGWAKGAVEAVSMKETLLLMKRLFPERTTIAVISDSTIPGRADHSLFMREQQGSGFIIRDISLEKLSFSEFNLELDSLDDGCVVLLLAAYNDRTGETRLFYDELDEIVRHTKVPVFHLYEHGLGVGIFGGKIISHYEQGRAAAQMVLKYFSGVPLGEIGILAESPNVYMFDYNQLKRFHVSRFSLPGGSVIVNRPHSFIELHPQVTLGGFLSIIFLSVITLLQFRRRSQLKREVATRTAELAKSNERLQTALKNANQIIWEWDLVTDDFLLVSANDKIGDKQTTMTVKKGQEWYDKLYPEDQGETHHKLFSHLRGEVPEFEASYRIKRDDGTYRWIITRGAVVKKDSTGKPLVMYGISTDITGIKEIEEEIRSSKQMLQIVIDTIPLGVFWKDLDLVYTGCNDQFASSAMLSSPDDIIGKRDMDLPWKEQSELHEKIDREVITSGRKKGFYEEESVSASGERKFLRKLKSPLTDMNGKVIGILGVQEDVTEARRLREQRVRMQKLESVGILAGGLAHDFNNMLMGIAGSLSVLKLREVDEKKLHWIDQALNSCSAAAEVTSRLITFARGGDPVMKVMNISGLIKTIVEMENTSGQPEVSIDISDEMPGVMADERQIGQVLRNLLENAREAVEAGGSITVSYHPAGDNVAVKAGLKEGRYVQVSVKDTGRGIEPDLLGKIFDPYFSTKDMGSQKGQGLSLTVCHSIIKNHGGVIFAESDHVRGTTFTFLLPVAVS